MTQRHLKVKIDDNRQSGYEYVLTEAAGSNFDPAFRPELTPQQMLELGVFGGNYFEGETSEFPSSWFKKAKISDHGHDASLNYYKVDASQPLKVWQQKGWIYEEDPRGWFQWYCRYYMGRRIPEEDKRQIARWKAINRHIKQVQNHCQPGDIKCRPRQRQAILHWAYDSRKI